MFGIHNSIWWRIDPLTQEEIKLLELFFRAHRASAFRSNISSVVIANTASGSGDIGKAIVAGFLTLGSRHAPLDATAQFLDLPSPANRVGQMLEAGLKIPGWGGTFQKNEPDPIWQEVDAFLLHAWPDWARKLKEVTAVLAAHGRMIYPNPSAYTSTVTLILRMPPKLAIYLFLEARINAWAEIAFKSL